jgi:hypothetical protein
MVSEARGAADCKETPVPTSGVAPLTGLPKGWPEPKGFLPPAWGVIGQLVYVQPAYDGEWVQGIIVEVPANVLAEPYVVRCRLGRVIAGPRMLRPMDSDPA